MIFSLHVKYFQLLSALKDSFIFVYILEVVVLSLH